MQKKRMQKRQVIVTAAVAATAAASSVLGFYPVHAETNESNTISKAASILGVDQQQLLDAFKKARIEMIEANIQKGIIDPTKGIEMIHKIEDSQDFHILPKYYDEEKMTLFDNLLKYLGISETQLTSLRKEGKSIKDIANDKGISEDQLKSYLMTLGNKYINDNIKDDTRKQKMLDNLSGKIEKIINRKLTKKTQF